MQHPPRLRKRTAVILIIVGVLVIIRLILPSILLHFANKRLTKIKGYYGHIDDIGLSLWRGAYKIDSIYLNKVDAHDHQTEFFSARLIDLSIEWRALFHGSIVGELEFDDPVLKFTKDKVEPSTLKKDSTSFKKLLDDFMPLRVNRFEVKGGRIRYIDQNTKPKVDIQLTEAHILARNLRNSYDSVALLPARVTATANVYGGTVDFNMRLNPLAPTPTFDLNAELKNTQLVRLNDFFQAYAKVDVNKGTFGLYVEAAAKNGKFDGYVKPVIKDLDVLGKEDRKDNLLQKAWEAIVGAVATVLTNPPKDQFATKVPIEGKIKDPHTNVWYAVTTVLRNAFIQAIQPAIDNDINIASVDQPKKKKKTFLERVFGKKEKKNGKNQN